VETKEQLRALQDRVLRNKRSSDEIIIENMCVIMNEFGYTIQEMKQMPITTFNFLCKYLEKKSKEQEKANKKNK
jgi:hypothetical protein